MIKLIVFALALTCLAGCVPMMPVQPEKTQLQIREFQTRIYDTTDTKMVMKAILNVLQDDGYMVKNANTELGLLTATKEVNIENKGQALFLTLLAGRDARYAKNSEIESTANVSEFGKQTKVRLNFQVKSYDNHGNVMEVKQIADEKFYQDFFAKADKGIFIQKQKI